MEQKYGDIVHRRHAELSYQDFLGFVKGQEAAFQKVFNLYYETIYHYAIKFLNQAEEAEELVQEVFISLFLNRTQFKDSSGIYPFLFTASKRMIISRFRRKVVESKFLFYLKNSWREESEGTTEVLNLRELNVILNQAIETLPSKQRMVYALNKFEGLSYQEIADRIGVSKNTVKNHLIFASKRVKSIIDSLYLVILVLSLI